MGRGFVGATDCPAVGGERLRNRNGPGNPRDRVWTLDCGQGLPTPLATSPPGRAPTPAAPVAGSRAGRPQSAPNWRRPAPTDPSPAPHRTACARSRNQHRQHHPRHNAPPPGIIAVWRRNKPQHLARGWRPAPSGCRSLPSGAAPRRKAIHKNQSPANASVRPAKVAVNRASRVSVVSPSVNSVFNGTISADQQIRISRLQAAANLARRRLPGAPTAPHLDIRRPPRRPAQAKGKSLAAPATAIHPPPHRPPRPRI